MWSDDTQFDDIMPSGAGWRAGKKRKRDDGELVAVDGDEVIVVDANGVAHKEARGEQANARVQKQKKKKKQKQNNN